MSVDGFMEGIYRGAFDQRAFHSYRPREISEKSERLLRDFRELLKEYPPSRLEAEGRIPPEMLQRMGKMGLFGLSIPRAYGGLELPPREYLGVVEELAGMDISIALASLAHLSIGVKGIALFGSEYQKQRYLVPAASGEMIFAYALTEPHVGSDAQNIEARAELSQDGSHYVLNGQKTYITNANYAGGLTVFAQMDPLRPGFMGAFIVETAWEGVKIGKDMPKMGLKASSTAAIQLRDVRVPRENLVAGPGDGFKVAMTVLNYGRIGLGAASVGMMNCSIKDMLNRASSRKQFGVAISRFPLIQEKIVKARVHSYVSSTMNAFTAGLLSENPLAGVAIESSHCKLFGTTRAWDVLYDALQVAGGSGYISTQPYEKRMRDFRVATVFEGTTEIHSIYPPLFAMRQIKKDMGLPGQSKTRQAWLLAESLSRKTDWPLAFSDDRMRKASRFARSTARAIRRMIVSGMLIYGNKISEKQLFLRRITTMSLYLFGVLALLARLDADLGSGALNEESLKLLDYFVEEAREATKAAGRILDSRKELLSTRIFSSMMADFKGTRDVHSA